MGVGQPRILPPPSPLDFFSSVSPGPRRGQSWCPPLAANDEQAEAVNELVIDGKVDPGLSETFSFDQIGHAHQQMHENKHRGNMACLVNATEIGSGIS